MPGHVKKSTGPDPDPSPWLIVSEELKKKLLSKPYDAKKSCWVPDKATHGYFEGLIETTEGDKVTVKLLETGEVSNIYICRISVFIMDIIPIYMTIIILVQSVQERHGGPSQPTEV